VATMVGGTSEVTHFSTGLFGSLMTWLVDEAYREYEDPETRFKNTVIRMGDDVSLTAIAARSLGLTP
jgi:hypothetical protein